MEVKFQRLILINSINLSSENNYVMRNWSGHAKELKFRKRARERDFTRILNEIS